MEIKVREIGEYCEVTIIDGLTTIESGFLGEDEVKVLAGNYLEAFDELMTCLKLDTNFIEDKVTEIREAISAI